MFAAFAVGFGRDSTGRHFKGRPHDPAIALGMDTIGYMLKLPKWMHVTFSAKRYAGASTIQIATRTLLAHLSER